jgi:hypothetical protein
LQNQKYKAVNKAIEPIGWYVRVATDQIYDGVYNTVLYIAGFPTPVEAEKAVRKLRSKPGEGYEVLEEIMAGRGPQPKRGEVRWIEGAV